MVIQVFYYVKTSPLGPPIFVWLGRGAMPTIRRAPKPTNLEKDTSMEKLTLAQADAIIEGTFAKGGEMEFRPLTVAVLDDGGLMVAFKKQDNSSVLRFAIAQGKAYGAIGMGTNSRNLAGVAQERPHFINALIGASDGKVVPVPGGILIKNADGDIMGSIGVSGDTSDNDEIAGNAGIEGGGLIPG